MNALFFSVLNMSITSSIVILVVLLVRLFLKKAPKIYSYVLWVVVLIRLICPFSFESGIGLLPINDTPIPTDIVYSLEPQIKTGLTLVDNVVNPMLPIPNHMGESINPLQIWVFVGSVIWLMGILFMLIYSMIQFIRLKQKLIGSTPLRDNIHLVDHTNSPFVIGFIKSKIYLPSSLAENEQEFIIAHEQIHIKRFDHVTRLFAFIALIIHWFNPLVWVAFVLSGKDMEMSCDEAVMKKMNTDIRGEYAKSLLRFATGRKFISGTPLAFGEGDTKDRVKNVMKYKKPMLWVSIVGAIVVICISVGLISNSKSDPIPTKTDDVSIEKLWNNRTEYVGDNSAVGNILAGLNFPETLEYNGFELDTKQEPYGITVKLTTDTKTSNFYIEASTQMSLYENAIILFSLIENVDVIYFSLEDSINTYRESFYRESAQTIMDKEDLFAATKTIESFSNFMKEIPISISRPN